MRVSALHVPPCSLCFSVSATFGGVWDHANSVGSVHVLVNGTSIFNGMIDRRSATSFSQTLNLAIGDTVDFAVGQAVPNDWTRSVLAADISPVGEPETFALSIAGLAFLASTHRRRSQQRIPGRVAATRH